jgi:hypothetical protein
MVLSKNVIFDEKSMLKHSLEIEVSESTRGSPRKDVIQVDIESTPINKISAVHQQPPEPTTINRYTTDSSDTSEDLGGDNDYQLARDREHRSIKPPQRYGFEDLATYNALLTSFGDASTFRESISSQGKDI